MQSKDFLIHNTLPFIRDKYCRLKLGLPLIEANGALFFSSQVDPVTQAKLQALLETTGIGKISGESKPLADPEVSQTHSYQLGRAFYRYISLQV